jgi:hypothetical protein
LAWLYYISARGKAQQDLCPKRRFIWKRPFFWLPARLAQLKAAQGAQYGQLPLKAGHGPQRQCPFCEACAWQGGCETGAAAPFGPIIARPRRASKRKQTKTALFAPLSALLAVSSLVGQV